MRIVLPLMHRRRHPLLQALSVIVGLAMIGVLLVFGLFFAGILLVGGTLVLALRQWKRRRAFGQSQASPPAQILEGEYVVLRSSDPVAH